MAHLFQFIRQRFLGTYRGRMFVGLLIGAALGLFGSVMVTRDITSILVISAAFSLSGGLVGFLLNFLNRPRKLRLASKQSFDANYDQRILEAIERATPGKPRDLAHILFYVDAVEKTRLSHEELAGGLRRLILEGRIAEAERHKFYGCAEGSAPGTFSGLTSDEYDQASWAYSELFSKTLEEVRKQSPLPPKGSP